jgi:hypothetical protein
LDEALKAALADIAAQSENPSKCWAKKLPEEALELLYAIEEMSRDGKSVNRRIAAEKFNELFDLIKPVSQGMVESHLSKTRGCACRKDRDYL